jgi:hypothetical protein
LASKGQSVEEQFRDRFVSCNFENSIDGILDDVDILIEKYTLDAIGKKVVILREINIYYTPPVEPYYMCCGLKMEIMTNSSQIICSKCKAIKDNDGLITEDYQYYSQENKKSKHSKYNPVKNFMSCLDKIQGKKEIELSDDIKRDLRTRIKRDRLGDFGAAPKLTLSKLRRYFKDLHITFLNSYSYLLSNVSGKSIPQLTPDETDRIKMIYEQLLEFKKNDKTFMKEQKRNNEYCPFFIHRIIELLFYEDSVKINILKFIYLLKIDTTKMLEKNTWEPFCKKYGYPFREIDFLSIE